MLRRIAEEVATLSDGYKNLFIIGKLISHDRNTGLARVESLNYNFDEPVYIEDVVILDHGNTYSNPLTGQIGPVEESAQHQWHASVGDLVLLIRVSDQIHILVGTVNALRNIQPVI